MLCCAQLRDWSWLGWWGNVERTDRQTHVQKTGMRGEVQSDREAPTAQKFCIDCTPLKKRQGYFIQQRQGGRWPISWASHLGKENCGWWLLLTLVLDKSQSSIISTLAQEEDFAIPLSLAQGKEALPFIPMGLRLWGSWHGCDHVNSRHSARALSAPLQ